MVKIGIVGGTGYTGVELIRLLLGHPQAELCAVTSRSDDGRALSELFPNLSRHTDLCFVKPDAAVLADCDVVFFATPHAVAMHDVPTFIARGQKVIDLSADYRIQDVALWERWYGVSHASPQLIEQAVYGLPEVNRSAITDAQLIACPGCYPTAVQLGFLPLLAPLLIDPQSLTASAVSGVSGAGRQAKLPNLYGEVSENFRAYGVQGHRHLPEIEQGLSVAAGQPIEVTFVPHLAPMSRGIHATLFAALTDDACNLDLQTHFEQTYADEPCVDVLAQGQLPETRSVSGLNQCLLSVSVPAGRRTVVVTVVEDNLVKGAAGQAVQCMNIMLGHDEMLGLGGVALLP
ncbi:MAG: N-acetyl-gamma-glutamyl-phosphate reductase [Pseudomonadota bacterium]